MPIDTRKPSCALILVAMALLASLSVSQAAAPPTADPSVTSAETFIQTMAQGHFKKAEANFTDQMKQAAPPDKLRDLWSKLTRHFGAFQKTSGHKTAVKDGYTVVVGGADFKNRTIGLQVAFDSAREIAGLYVVPAP